MSEEAVKSGDALIFEDEIEFIAAVAHNANRAYCQSIGDNSQAPWDDAPEWQKASAIEGVKFHIQHPDATPEASHGKWVNHKLLDGWKYGPVKDAEKKEHPCMITYESLPPEQKAKDAIYCAIVKTMLGDMGLPHRVL